MLCEEKRNITVEYAIESLQKPIGIIAQFKLTEELPTKLKSYLPSPKDLARLKKRREKG
ncbi:hypothetical protein NBT09_07310 [Rickettsia conorii subsp. raoultii]|uniref:Acyl-[acyl-carrier-protein]--UDP-N-acetylglucosamine O-acyltransferase n=1 Tax=Rickettsia conorii subsp. raoultii TaxID=369822 RepID=A0ABY4U2G1_RICCR|nr:hypothetical protein [Rickettsia conorii]URW78489.1 hypothetical protein NBT09_07310 [Rickettsia conorii subsp. raoultii]